MCPKNIPGKHLHLGRNSRPTRVTPGGPIESGSKGVWVNRISPTTMVSSAILTSPENLTCMALNISSDLRERLSSKESEDSEIRIGGGGRGNVGKQHASGSIFFCGHH
ncbi:hypothetical protein AMTR_s00010p00190560 [Amborella trichopoda]|uniref:Uncharacterized protein n=1 Tax=Amborella trichopoda TaxID=13333 RepID=W1NFH5_AMBTC|nr:hypothetical protein AMTR_s00010p00190560 [Amborella trichopoda]